jgi:HlyD family secretion protein
MAEHKRKHPPVPVIVVVVLLLIGGGIWWWWSSTQTGTAAADSAFTGTVEAQEYQVAPALAGRVTAVRVVEGAVVTKDQELLRVDRAAFNLQLSQAKQGVTAAKAAYTNAKNDDDSTKADIAAAKARLKQAEAAVELARVQLGYTIIGAPHGGTVVSITTNVGQNAAPARAVMTITDPNDLYVRMFVPETEIGKVKIGQSARLTTDSGTQAYSGTVSFIASESEFTPNNVQTKDQRVKLVYEVRVRTTDPSGVLKAGMPVDVTLG